MEHVRSAPDHPQTQGKIERELSPILGDGLKDQAAAVWD